MSVESPPPPFEEPPADSSDTSPEENANEQDWLPKVKRRHRKSEGGNEAAEATDREILVLCSLLLTNLLDKRSSVVEEPPESRLKANRIPSKAGGLPAAVPLASASAPAAPMIRLKPRTSEGAMGKAHWQTSSSGERFVKYLMIALVVAAVLYFFARRFIHFASILRGDQTSQSSSGPAPKLTALWSLAAISQLDAVLEADQNGDLKTARQLAFELRKRMPDSPDLDLYLSTLMVRDGEYNKPEEDVTRMINAFTPPLLAAAINEHLGFIYARKRDLPLAISAFSDAAAADPFNAVHFYHLGETLRRKGQLQEGIDRLREALTRLPVGVPLVESQRDEIEFKINLTKIELGTDDDVKMAIAEHLGNPSPAGHWLLIAAAYNLQHGLVSAAADDLRRARAVLPPDDYVALTGDYFLRGFAEHEEVSALLNTLPGKTRTQMLDSRMGYFVDP